MKVIQPYLYFNGNTREAMAFYADVLGGTLFVMTYAEGPPEMAEGGDRILHARLTAGPLALMASDPPPNRPVGIGSNVGLSLECDSPEEQDRLFTALGEGGRTIMPLQDTFWGSRYGMLYDRFGIQWLLDYPNPQAAAAAAK